MLQSSYDLDATTKPPCVWKMRNLFRQVFEKFKSKVEATYLFEVLNRF